MNPTVSRRGATQPSSPIRRLAGLAEEAKARGIHIHHLNIGQPDVPTVPAMVEAYRRYDAKVIGYSPSQGLASLRAAWAASYNRQGLTGACAAIEPDEVLITVGGSEALALALAATCDHGDAILLAEPYYTNYRGIAHVLGVELRAVATSADDGFALDIAAVAAAWTPEVRAFVIPSPGNPTGAVLDRRTLDALGALAVERGGWLILDEVYREFVYDGSGVAPSALAIAGAEQHVIVVDSVSKRYSACGARIGALVARNRALLDAALRIAQARLSPPTVDQVATLAALQTPPEAMQAMIATYHRRRDVLVAALAEVPGVVAPCPAGAFYLIARLPVANSDAFCRWLLTDFSYQGETVMLAPAEGFYATPGRGVDEVRMAYVIEEDALRRAVRCLAVALRQWPAA